MADGDRNSPATMRAAQLHRYGGPEVLTIGTLPVPTPRAGEVLVRVGATSLNGGELLFRAGKLRVLTGSRFPKGLGVDFAGEVVALGDGVADVALGDRVWGIINSLKFAMSGAPSGTAAEYVVVGAERVERSHGRCRCTRRTRRRSWRSSAPRTAAHR